MYDFKVIIKLGDVIYQAKPKIAVEGKKKIKGMKIAKPNNMA